MRSRPALIAVMTLVLLHQLVAGVFAGGTILCISGAGGVALQPVGMTCCAVHGPRVSADACCAEEDSSCELASAKDCQGCIDHLVAMQPTLPPHAVDLALPPSASTLVAVIAWPSPMASVWTCRPWHDPQRSPPPPLAFLSTIILRC